MQAINLERLLYTGLRHREFRSIFYFTGTMPSSVANLPFDPYNYKEVSEACVGSFATGWLPTDRVNANGRMEAMEYYDSTAVSLFTKELYIDDSRDRDGSNNIVRYSVPSISQSYERTYGNNFSFRSWRNIIGRLNTGNVQYDVGTTNADACILFGKEQTVSGLYMQQDNDRAEISNNVFRNSRATTLRVWRYIVDPNDSSQLRTELLDVSDYGGLGVGNNTIQFDKSYQAHGLFVTAVAGTGDNAPGVSAFRAPRAQWRLRMLRAFVDTNQGGNANIQTSPTWAIMYNYTFANTGNGNDISTVTESYAGQDYQIPIMMFDVGPAGSGRTLELVDYPIPPGTPPRIEKFNISIDS